MDVIIPFGIKYKKCSKKSYSDFKKQQLIPYLEKNLIEKNTEVVMGIIAEIHCSSYYDIPRRAYCRNRQLFCQC